jgi:phage terminase large subunit-like protein
VSQETLSDDDCAFIEAMQFDRLTFYAPYPKQREFHLGGAAHHERLFLAGNQLGKTLAGGAETAIHLCGQYPEWWAGFRFNRPIVAWAAGITGESTRDTVQRMLMGRTGSYGTGMIPAASIAGFSRAIGVRDLVDTVRVRHESGGESILAFKFYEKGREKWQGETLDLVWFDEEPPEEIYSEGITRLNATGGIGYITATPLLGATKVLKRFYPKPDTPDRHITQMTIEDAEHYTPEQRAAIIAKYPAHERDARARGIPMLGSGRIFPVDESLIACDPFAVSPLWPQIGGLDFGWDHPFAAVRMAWDKDSDTVYVTAAHRVSEQTPILHAAAIKPWGDWLPWAWPHDGLQHSKDSGKPLADQYRAQGLKLTVEHARFPDNPDGTKGGYGVEAGIMDMLDRMQTGRWKVFRHLSEWFDEFRNYHRDEGQIVKENDDLLSASRYALMMLREAKIKPRDTGFNRKIVYPNLGAV